MHPLFALVIGTVCVFLHGVSLVAKNETVRGLGRLFLGFSLVCYAGAVIGIASAFSLPGAAAVCGYVLGFVGLVTLGSGVHKYRRRNVAQ